MTGQARLSTVVAMNVIPREGQTPEEAAAEMANIFDDYLTESYNSFLSDYGEDTGSGHSGPWVDDVKVVRL